MRNVILLMHVSLDGFVAGPNGEMDWILVDDEEMWEYVNDLTNTADTALYGRATYEMMEGYWPTAAEQPGATKHDIDHGRWYNSAHKLVFSRTLAEGEQQNTRLIKEHIAEEIAHLKQQPGKNLVMFGSPSLAQTFMQLGLIDEYWLNVNPVILGSGISLFPGLKERILLKLVEARTFRTGVVGLRYQPDKS
jgi:dihydrofolate reductase